MREGAWVRVYLCPRARLADEEHHIDYLETQLRLLETLGEALYLQNVIEHPRPE